MSDDMRRRLEQYEAEWLWHEADDEVRAGHGHHMGQMLYRLPKDGQTRDMKASIESMLADLRALLHAGPKHTARPPHPDTIAGGGHERRRPPR